MPDPHIVISSGEPAGIGPDIVAAIDPARFDAQLTVVGDIDMLRARAAALGAAIDYVEAGNAALKTGQLQVLHQPLRAACEPGRLDVANAPYVLDLLETACLGCLQHRFDAMVTAPVQKEIVNRAGIEFSGHTEFLAGLCQIDKPVMLLLTGSFRVALVTTHLPLREVADAIDENAIREVVTVLDRDLRRRFAIENPHIKVCGLNPHAGENGYLGREELDIIIPALQRLEAEGIKVSGPYPADTLFTKNHLSDADAVLAMYHDQGLPVLKHVGFHDAVNTTLGLPILRTSVDHGTALDLAGSGQASAGSLIAAIDSAIQQANCLSNAARA